MHRDGAPTAAVPHCDTRAQGFAIISDWNKSPFTAAIMGMEVAVGRISLLRVLAVQAAVS
jgi:hypothetical protein